MNAKRNPECALFQARVCAFVQDSHSKVLKAIERLMEYGVASEMAG